MKNKQLPALIRWENYIKQFPKLQEYWLMVPEPAKTLFQQQINVYGSHFQDTIDELYEREARNKVLIDGLIKKYKETIEFQTKTIEVYKDKDYIRNVLQAEKNTLIKALKDLELVLLQWYLTNQELNRDDTPREVSGL